MEKTTEKAIEKAQYFLKRAKETSSLETKLILLNNAYNCFDGLEPLYSVVFMSKEEFQAIINACVNDSDCDVQGRPFHYDLKSICETIQTEVEKILIC